MQLATRVYASSYGNTIGLPSKDWDQVDWLPDEANGFSAGVYKKDATKERKLGGHPIMFPSRENNYF